MLHTLLWRSPERWLWTNICIYVLMRSSFEWQLAMVKSKGLRFFFDHSWTVRHSKFHGTGVNEVQRRVGYGGFESCCLRTPRLSRRTFRDLAKAMRSLHRRWIAYLSWTSNIMPAGLFSQRTARSEHEILQQEWRKLGSHGLSLCSALRNTFHFFMPRSEVELPTGLRCMGTLFALRSSWRCLPIWEPYLGNLETSNFEASLFSFFSDPAWQALFSILDSRFSVLDSRFSVLDSRFLVLDSRFSILDSRFSILDSRFSIILDSRFSILDFRFSILDSRFSILDSRFSILDSRFSILGSRFSVLDSRFSILDSRFSIFDSRFSILGSRFSVLDSRFSILDSRFSILGSRFSILDSRFSILDSRFSALDSRFFAF